MFRCFSLLTLLFACSTQAIQVKPSYGPPPQRTPHREYGVPQQMPFREYGPPSFKYGPPKLNFIGGGGSGAAFHEEIKNHYGAPKPYYGPPYKPQQQYGPPASLPLRPVSTYGPPPLKLQLKPAASYGPPKTQYGAPSPQALPLLQAATQFKPSHQPASSYGPPPSGPLNIPPKKIYGPPPPNYGPPPLPNFNHGPQTTIIVAGGQNSPSHQQQQQVQHQTQIQVDASGHTHSVVGSQAPFHTACDGWKPIASPAGAYIENNHIETQTGYSQVSQAQAQAHGGPIQYSGTASAAGSTGIGATAFQAGPAAGGNSLVDGLSDEQLVAVALQSGNFDIDNGLHQQNVLPSSRPPGDFNGHGLNSIEAEALQISLGSTADSYSKPPADSYAPGIKYTQHNFNQHSSGHSSHGAIGISGPGGIFKQTAPNGRFGPPRPPHGNYGPPALPPKGIYGPPPSQGGNFGPPPPPVAVGNYGPPPLRPAHGHAFGNHHNPTGVGIQYGKQTGNLGPFPPHGAAQPSRPVAYRPPVPQGLFETIGATVQHLDKFGVKPLSQAPTYIPPAASEIPQTGPGNQNLEYGAPPQQSPQNFAQQQLPQQSPAQVFIQSEQQQQQHQQHSDQQQQQQQHTEYGIPPPPPPQQGPAQAQYLPPPLPAQTQEQYLPPTGPQQQQFNGGSSYSSSATASFGGTAFAASQYNNEVVHAQPLPLQQEQPRFHDCGHGPNLLGGGNYNFQQQQQQQQQQFASGSSTSIAQSIPVAEQHIHFVSEPASSYGPPPSGGNDFDHIGYASEKSQVTALPGDANLEAFPGLSGLNLLSAQKSEAIHLSSQEIKSNNAYQYGTNGQGSINHEEILSADLLQKILNAVEQPQAQHQPLPANHKAESRSDNDLHEGAIEGQPEVQPEVEQGETKGSIENDNLIETPADVQEIQPIVVKEEDEARH